MSDLENKENSRWQKWKDTYKVVIIDPDTLKEVNTFHMSRLLLAGIAGLGAFAAILIFSLIVLLTPLRNFIPGYGDIQEHSVLLQMNEQLQVMEEQLAAEQLMANAKLRALGDMEANELPTSQDEQQEEFPDSLLNVPRIKEDELLRKEIEFDQKVKQKAILTSSDARNMDVSPEQLFFVPPLTGVMSAGFDALKKHYGTDITAPKNSPIQAVLDGYVFIADWTIETGFTIGIQHDNELISFYKHNSALLKQTGDRIKAGEAIAIIGNSGTLSSGPHLHFELWHRGIPIDAEDFIVFQ